MFNNIIANRDTDNSTSAFPLPVTVLVIFLCILPFTLNMLGIDFASGKYPLDVQTIVNGNLTLDSQFYALTGALQHVLLEWSAVIISGIIMLLSFAHYNVNRDISVPILGMAFLCCGFMDAFHTLAATRLIEANAPNTDFIPFTWALSRLFNAIILFIGIFIILKLKPRINEEQNKNDIRILWIIGITFTALSIFLILEAAIAENLPQTQYPDSMITRPFDAIPLGIYICSFFIFIKFHKRFNNLLSYALILNLLPEIATEAHMAFGSTDLFDNHFNIAHSLKILTYIVPFIGLLFDYMNTNKELKKSKTELLIAKNNAIIASKLKSEFLANMSHEIRTPMTAIIGMSNILNKTSLTEEQKEYSSIISSSANSLLVIINDILDFSKMESDKMQLEPHPFDLENLLFEVSEVIKFQADEKGLIFNYILTPETPKYLIADAGRLKQVLINLANNACKFTHSGHVTISISQTSINETHALIDFSVIDTGIGIAPDMLNHIFDTFSQADGSITRNFGGTGLGLSISKKFIDLMGGKLQVTSELNLGSSFSFQISMPIDHQCIADTKNIPATEISTSDLRDVRILLVEDNLINMKIAVAMLKQYQCNITTAMNGQEAIDIYETSEFDIILMDCQMPILDGFKASQLIRQYEIDQQKTRTPIIAFTANAMKGDQEICFKAGMDDYLAKPIDESHFISTLLKWVPQKQKKTKITKNEIKNMNDQKTTLVDFSVLETLKKSIGEDYLEIIELYINYSIETVASIDRAIISNDSALQHREAHSLKACSQQVGAAQLGDILQELENHAEEKQTDKCKELFSQVEALYPLVNNELTEFLKNQKKAV